MSQPASRPDAQTTFREAEKEARAFEKGGAVRVFGERGYLVARLNESRDAERIRLLMSAPNAVPVRTRGGRLVGIRLLSLGDDRGHSGEQHGTSLITTERVRNDDGVLVGGDHNLKHKNENANHAAPPPVWATDGPRGGPVRAPLAAKH
jgi:hypothetical protein